MSDKKLPHLDPHWPRGWEEHERERILFIVKNTTPLQRLKWVEAALKLFGDKIKK